MGQLEKTLVEASVEKPELKVSGSYRGLELVEENVYRGGTGIKYWM